MRSSDWSAGVCSSDLQLARRQIALLPFAAALLIAVSLATPRWIRRLACLGLIASIVLLVLTLVAGPEIKGATRWISLGSLSLQPSEFAKPCFAVVTAWLFSLDHEEIGRAEGRGRRWQYV